MSQTAVTLFSPEGEAKKYRPLATRLPEFFTQYPPTEFSMVTGYEACPFSNGRPVFVFKASLLDKEGRLISTAHARREIFEYKDFESGETAARQRLLAALGHGGDVLDEDENNDFRAQNLLRSGSHERPRLQVTPLRPAPEAPTPEAPTPEAPAPEVPAPEAPAPEAPTSKSESKASPKPSVATARDDATAKPIPPALLSHLNMVCKQRGMEVPQCTTAEQVRAAILAITKTPLA